MTAFVAPATAPKLCLTSAAGTSSDVDRDRARHVGLLLEFLRRAVGDDLAAVDDDGARAGGLDFLQDVGGENDRLLLAHPLDQLADLVFLVRVQAVGGFVQDQHLRIVNDGLGETGAVPVALGERVDALVQHRFEESTSRPRAAPPCFLASPRETAQLGGKVQEAVHRHVGVGGRVFGQIADQALGRRWAVSSMSKPPT